MGERSLSLANFDRRSRKILKALQEKGLIYRTGEICSLAHTSSAVTKRGSLSFTLRLKQNFRCRVKGIGEKVEKDSPAGLSCDPRD
jgi:hypothetical protein